LTLVRLARRLDEQPAEQQHSDEASLDHHHCAGQPLILEGADLPLELAGSVVGVEDDL
jgi:hypothetical protein